MAIGEIFQESLSTLSSSSSSLSSSNSSFKFIQSVSPSEVKRDGLKACPPSNSSEFMRDSVPKWENWWRLFRPTNLFSSTITNEDGSSPVRQPKEYSHRHHPYRHKLNSTSRQLTVVLVLIPLLLACFPIPVGSASPGQDDKDDLECVKGVSPPFPGATFPRGDIILKEGDTLEVYCKLNLTSPSAEGYNASFIDFQFHKADVRAEQVVTKVINETTAVVRVRNMNASSIFLRCDLKRPNGSRIQVCQNQIEVGFPPLPVEDFRCVANEWTSLNCTWKLPSNPVPTKYTLTKLWKTHRYNNPIPCPMTTTTPTSCSWGKRTEPHYRQNTDPLEFRLNGTNALVPSGITWDYRFSLGSIVIPEPPTIILTKKSAMDYKLNWTFPNYEYFQPGLEHQLTICCEFESKCNVKKFRTKPVDGKMTPYVVTDILLPLANANYNITVRLRSPEANDTVEFWSTPAVQSVKTEAKAPTPPETDVGSYENEITRIQTHIYRDIYIYWKSIPDRYKNGSDFKYQIDVFENERKLSNIPQVINESYAKFTKLNTSQSYLFRIYAENSRGKSLNASEISVPSVAELPQGPKSVSKLDFTNGSFEISWKRPDKYHGILSYTVFSCSSKMPRPYQCEGPLKRDRVDASPSESIHKFYNFLPQDSDRIYQFAVSANTAKFSSGLIWATYCTLIHNKVPGKLRTVRYEDPKEDEILIKWDLECSYQSGDIEGFKITYCQVEQYPAESCKDDGASSVAVEGANMTTYRLMKLKPYSYYKIDISILAAAGQSQRSDPIYARTSEGAPSHARVSRINHLTNVSATLLIESPIHLNGLLREYQIYYVSKTDNKEKDQKVPLQVSNNTKSFSKEVTLGNLTSRTTYVVYIIACTTKCSTRSDPFEFETDIGHTDLTSFPEISMDGSKMLLKWRKPDRLGGPINYFEVLLKQNGEHIGNMDGYRTNYRNGSQNFEVEIPQSCEQGTNFTAQVRAVTILNNSQYLYGAWSPPANYSCGVGVSWLIWLMLAFLAFAGVLFFAYLSMRFYHYFRHMKEVPIKLPPGLNSELNGFTHKPPPRSRSSDQSYGKEPFSYPLQPTSRQLDESKDFLSSSELNQGEAEESLIEKPFCPSPTNPLLDFSNTSNGGSMEDEEHDIGLTEFSNLRPDQCSSPTYKKLGALANGGCPVSVEPTPGPSSRNSPSTSVTNIPTSQSSSHPHPSSLRIEPSSSTTCNGINRTVPDVLSSSPSSPTSHNPISSSSSSHAPSPPPPVPVVPPVAAAPAPSSSYVRWTTLVPDMRTGDDGGINENGTRQSPYCQVGILLDS